jgi:hypothetical protein
VNLKGGDSTLNLSPLSKREVIQLAVKTEPFTNILVVKLKLQIRESKRQAPFEVCVLSVMFCLLCGCAPKSDNESAQLYITADDGLMPTRGMLEPFYDSVVIELVGENGEIVSEDENHASEAFSYAFQKSDEVQPLQVGGQLLQKQGWSLAEISRSKLFRVYIGQTYSVNVRIAGHTKDLVSAEYEANEAKMFRRIRIPNIEVASISTSDREEPIKDHFKNRIQNPSDIRFLFRDCGNPGNYIFPFEETGTTTTSVYAVAGSVLDLWLVNLNDGKADFYKSKIAINVVEKVSFPLVQSFRVEIESVRDEEIGPNDYFKLLEQRK